MRAVAAAVCRPVSREFIAINHHNWHPTTTGTLTVLVTTHCTVYCLRRSVSTATASSLTQQLFGRQRVAWPIVGRMSTGRGNLCIGQWLCSVVVDSASLSSCRRTVGKHNSIIIVILCVAVWFVVTLSLCYVIHCSSQSHCFVVVALTVQSSFYVAAISIFCLCRWLVNPFNASCFKFLLFDGFSAILV